MSNNFPCAFHNVAQLIPVQDGFQLQRVPEELRLQLNEGAQRQARWLTATEIRFVWDWEQPAQITLTGTDKTQAVFFLGPFQCHPVHNIRQDRVTLTLTPHERLANLELAQLPAHAFSPRVGRLLLMDAPVILHDVSGPGMRPPRPEEVPHIRYAAYGSSITHGAFCAAPHLPYPQRIGRALQWDVINLGFRGSALAEAAMADYIAQDVDWDVLTLEASVNMARFAPREFAARWSYFLPRIARAHPHKPIVVLNMFHHFRDLPLRGQSAADTGAMQEMRESIRTIVRELDSPHVTLLEDEQLLRGAFGLTHDLLHPGDAGFEAIAHGVVAHLRQQLAGGSNQRLLQHLAVA